MSGSVDYRGSEKTIKRQEKACKRMQMVIYYICIYRLVYQNKEKIVMENAVLNNILTRRSCRSYTDREVNRGDIDTILKAGIYAPSGMNLQSWQFTVIRKKENILGLAEVVRKTLNRQEGYNFYNPNVIILVSNSRDNTNGLADCACAMENMFLMAHELGIASCWINQLKEICDVPEVRAELDKYNVPKDHVVWGIVDLGYAKEELKMKEKNESVIVYAD